MHLENLKKNIKFRKWYITPLATKIPIMAKRCRFKDFPNVIFAPLLRPNGRGFSTPQIWLFTHNATHLANIYLLKMQWKVSFWDFRTQVFKNIQNFQKVPEWSFHGDLINEKLPKKYWIFGNFFRETFGPVKQMKLHFFENSS